MHFEQEPIGSIANLSKDGIKMRRRSNHSAKAFKNTKHELIQNHARTNKSIFEQNNICDDELF